MNRSPIIKDKVLQIRCNQEFLDTVDELRAAFGMNKTEIIEFAIRLFPILAGQKKDGNNG